MRINRALGLALVIIILQFLVPKIFTAGEEAVIKFFHTSETAFESIQAVVVTGADLPVPKVK
ncbi:MAG: hypothetical protein A3G52_04400 [Candidatus Taylorbacteria bacterium RIFCSPLOWO2_12_FULL_43_20]|uniref:Uncharacterized protein n=1 Tax=Candidatus Taylorbacteria bacterium RIFCSPLOWO2_12_FULL_43_20 TaxID=1802332 RepID=A0A1G2NZE7_9BACT|nr:MAG: hypothetical protein A3B98_02060 [Candidatus Taylorbacteria bacterium RIFCSPHIGHO2_02_FULL_43_55]OHA27887.1 MAG: hypothetical protein A3E92_01975 [Candidatus Taylorbacteria bacterium RIFCSPHIGHO2_12_FULL_42_34]OHA32163.1 MAG: hypothetical protein A3B09_03290 [Candidatus Taylorbacteria bacterium RIFCSPLOWO2_01_FULL_43_83]OHA37708.1 MAG: hypothetical protein A3H58_01055 [Candidatus Taylorbacteria bacterium RIFCSPLOWO2_02_FULL_43_22b]OHA41403.1 MAG: hypothetical protein A3G52_04400 [Candid